MVRSAEMALPSPAEFAQNRLSMTPRQVSEATGAPLRLVRRLIRSGDLRSKRAGSRVFVDPASVRRLFGFEPEKAPRPVEDQRIREMAERVLERSG